MYDFNIYDNINSKIIHYVNMPCTHNFRNKLYRMYYHKMNRQTYFFISHSLFLFVLYRFSTTFLLSRRLTMGFRHYPLPLQSTATLLISMTMHRYSSQAHMVSRSWRMPLLALQYYHLSLLI